MKPSEKGTTWLAARANGPDDLKKLMHQAGILGESFSDANAFGWTVEEKQQHDWGKMRDSRSHRIFEFRVPNGFEREEGDYKNGIAPSWMRIPSKV